MTRYRRDSTPRPIDLTLRTFKHIPIHNQNNISHIQKFSHVLLCAEYQVVVYKTINIERDRNIAANGNMFK